MSNEIKLGWYQRKSDQGDKCEVVYSTPYDNEIVIKGKNNTKSIFIWCAESLLQYYDYIGPEPQGQTTMHDKLIQAGFTPPTNRYSKPDPRGQEYGFFEVYPSSFDKGSYIVSHTKDKYTMKFANGDDFKNWAKGYT